MYLLELKFHENFTSVRLKSLSANLHLNMRRPEERRCHREAIPSTAATHSHSKCRISFQQECYGNQRHDSYWDEQEN